MTANHPSRTWKGCALCKPHKRHGVGRSGKDPIAVAKKLGKRRRLTRRDLGG